MSTYAKIEQKHTDDERWLAAGADAFAVHVAAVVYCDRLLTDGHITHGMALRVSLAVPPDRAPAAIAALVEHGFWRTTTKGYRIEKFHEHAFPAEQVQRTRDRWQADKNRRRQHKLGDHSLCKDPTFCPAIREESSTVESSVDDTVESTRIDKDQTKTRPDRRDGSGNGMGEDGSASSDGLASLAASSAAPSSDPERPWAAQQHPGHGVALNGEVVTRDGLR